MGDLSIRAARPSDAEACARLALEPAGGLNVLVASPSLRVRIAEAVFSARETAFGFDRTLVAEEDGSVVGLVSRFRQSDWPKLRVRTGLVMLRAAGLARAPALVWRGRAEEAMMPPIPPGAIHVMSLAVDPSARSRGIGSALLGAVTQEARTGGIRVVTLDVARDNGRAIRFYEREGFRLVSGHQAPARRGLPPLASIRMERPIPV